MGKFKMPTVKRFLEKKRIYWRKREPVWVYLEAEMRANVAFKPYNDKVGLWLNFLRDLRYYFHCENKRILRKLQNDVGPPWYAELSNFQRSALEELPRSIHQDLIENTAHRTRRSLYELGLVQRLPTKLLLKIMKNSYEDAGLFFWSLYTCLYGTQPNVIQKDYDLSARIMLTCLVYIDYDDCVQALDKLAQTIKPAPLTPRKTVQKYFQPNCKYGEYLQKLYVPFYSNHPSEREMKERIKRKPPELAFKIKLRSEESYENLVQDSSFLARRIELKKKAKIPQRICKFKFWEAPAILRNTDPKLLAYLIKLKMIKTKARTRYLKHKPPLDNLQFHVGTVAYTGGSPHYLINSIVSLPTGYMFENRGCIMMGGEYITQVGGFWRYPRHAKVKCQDDCDCLTKWGDSIFKYIVDSKCKCGHHYDTKNEGKPTEKYFYPPTSESPYFLDLAKVFQFDSREDFIKDQLKQALKSESTVIEKGEPSISASNLNEKQLLEAFLADLADSTLLIPHLPKAHLLPNLGEWVRHRIMGAITPEKHRQNNLESERSWLNLKHIDFRARAYYIPFTVKQLEHFNWSHRYMVQDLFDNLLEDFVTRNKMKQIEQTRLWWPTMKFDTYPSKTFLDVFFTYMPGRMQDIFCVNPYSSILTKKSPGKTCPLK